VGAGSFKTLVTAVQAAGLVDTLKGTGPFTVFAPTDEAFAKLPAGTVEELLKPQNKSNLQAILTYHVVPGKVMAAADFTKIRGRVLGRPIWLPLLAWATRVIFGEMADALLLASARVEPSQLLRSGYTFRFPQLDEALRHVLGK
jgi:hypothetical protein